MRRPKLTRPTVEPFERDGSALDVNDLYRRGAFRSGQSLEFPIKRLRTFPDHMEINFRGRPAQLILIERTRLHLGGTRPWFVCHRCQRRVGKLYSFSIDVLCRKCYGLQYLSQRLTPKRRLLAKAARVRSQLWLDGEKIIRPRYMHARTYKKHLRMLRKIELAIDNDRRIGSARYRRWRQRDGGQYCDGQTDYELI
jgi:hypothetical protein